MGKKLSLLVAIVYAFILVPVIIVVVSSFSASRFITFPPQGWSLIWYENFLTEPLWMNALYASATLAVLAPLISIIISIPAAITMTRYNFRFKDSLRTFLLSPLTVPVVLIGISLAMLQREIGLLGSLQGLLIGHLILTLPYAVRSIMVSLEGLPTSIEEAAINLGATPFQTFYKITLPLMRPGIIAAALYGFIWSFEDVSVSVFLAGRTTTLPVRMWGYIYYKDDPTIAAISTFCVVLVIAAFLLLQKTVREKTLYGAM